MLFRRYASFLVSTSILIQSVLPTFSMEADLINEIDRNLPLFSKFSSTPAFLSFKSQPERTAAGVLHWSKKDDDVLILLGNRNDGKGWSNLGGGSDAADCTLDQDIFQGLEYTAAREVCEESNGIYAHHPRLLRKQPFIALYSPNEKDGFLHYMYWQEVQYLEPEIFNRKVKAATEAHNQEYSDFIWVKANLIHQAVEAQTPHLNINGTNIEIFAPLFTSLSTLSGETFLHELTTHQKIRRFKKEIRPLVNRLYIAKNPDEHAAEAAEIVSGNKISVHWEIPKIHGTPKANQAVAVPFGKNAFKKFYAKQQIVGPKGDILSEKNVFFDAKKEEDIFAEAVSAHGAAMVELKRTRQVNTPPQAEPSETWSPHCEKTLSQIHLHIALGEGYKNPEEFPQSNNPTRTANLANIKAYFAKYNEGELKREVTLLESDYDFFAHILEWEKENGQWPTFYHGASARMNNLFKSFISLRRISTLCPLNDFVVLRGTDAYLKNDKIIWDILNRTGPVENAETKCAMLFMNYVLLAGLKTTKSTSSSAEYTLNNHSVEEQNIVERFKEAMALAGFSNPEYAYFNSLFEQYVAHKHPTEENSVMLAVSQNPKGLDDYNYPTICGKYYRNNRGQEITSSLQIITGIQNEYERQKKGGFEPFSTNAEAKASLIPENRFFLHPDRALDPKLTRSKSFDRFALSPMEQNAYDRLMHHTATALSADWLAQKTSVMDGAFVSYPLCKTLYKMIYKNIAGEESVESFSIDGFMHLLSNKCFNAIDNYIKIYPEVLNLIDTSKLNIHQKMPLLNALIPHHIKLSGNLLEWYKTQYSSYVEYIPELRLERFESIRCMNIISSYINDIDFDNIKSFQRQDLMNFMGYLLHKTGNKYEEFPWFKKILKDMFEKSDVYITLAIADAVDSYTHEYEIKYSNLIKGILKGASQKEVKLFLNKKEIHFLIGNGIIAKSMTDDFNKKPPFDDIFDTREHTLTLPEIIRLREQKGANGMS